LLEIVHDRNYSTFSLIRVKIADDYEKEAATGKHFVITLKKKKPFTQQHPIET
jgi:hypothetical protein